MFRSLGRLVLLVKDYDEALAFYRETLGFKTIVDFQAGALRFVHAGLPEQDGIGIWFLQARTEEQLARVGNQTGGEPCFVLYTDTFHETYNTLRERGVDFLSEPHISEESIFVHFHDLYGNEIVLVTVNPHEDASESTN